MPRLLLPRDVRHGHPVLPRGVGRLQAEGPGVALNLKIRRVLFVNSKSRVPGPVD